MMSLYTYPSAPIEWWVFPALSLSLSLSDKYNLITREVDKVFAFLSKIEKDTF